MRRVIKLGKPAIASLTMKEMPMAVAVPVPVALAVPTPVRKVIKLGKPMPMAMPMAKPVPTPIPARRVIKVKKPEPLLPVPPPPPHGIALTRIAEAFEGIREYYALRDEPIPQQDLKWYQTELALEKKEMDEFWLRCSVTKAIMEETMKSYITGQIDEVALMKIEIEAKAIQKALPIRKEDLGPMPSYGTPEFWSWCHKRKKLRLQEEAVIIAAGGTVKPVKGKSKPKPTCKPKKN